MDTELEANPEEAVLDPETNPEDIEADPNQADESGEPSTKEEDQESEIVLEGDEGSQPSKKRRNKFSHRINRKNAQIAESNERAEKAEMQLEAYKTALQTIQGNQTPGLIQPDPADENKFPEGVHDPAYIKQFNDFLIKSNQQGVNQQIQEAQKQTASFQNQQTQQDNLQQAKSRHYERASELKVSDFEEMEDNAIKILGDDVFNELVKNCDNSPEVAYLLGKNPDEALRIRRLADNGDAFKCVMELGKLSAKTKVKTKSAIPADPESKIANGNPPVSTNNLQKEFDAAIDSDNFARAREIEAQAEKRGVQIKKV
ncbi:MAG: hypothetical protein V3R41_03415 [Gammaproteobacteria bacterium]